MTGQPERLRDLLPQVVADLAARHHATNGAAMTNRDDEPGTPNEGTQQQWHVDPALHAHVTATAAEIAEHFISSRLGVSFTDDASTWRAHRETDGEGWAQ